MVMHIPKIWQPKFFKRVGNELSNSRLETQRHFEIREELGKSLLAVMHQTACNRDYAKLLRHGYHDMFIRTDQDGNVVGMRYTKNGRTIVLPFPVVVYRAMLRKLYVYNADWDLSKVTTLDKLG